MEEKLNNLVLFALRLCPNAEKVIDYYAVLQAYCCRNVHEPITQDFNDVIGHRGGVTLFYTKLRIFLLEQEMIKNPNQFAENDLKNLRERYEERYQEYVGNIFTTPRI